MKLAILILFAIGSLLCLGFLIHYIRLTVNHPEKFIDSHPGDNLRLTEKIYFAGLCISAATFGWGGARTLLSWIPDSVGGFTEYGDYITLRDSIAIYFAITGVWVLSKFGDYAEKKVWHVFHRIRAEELEKMLYYGLPSLKQASIDYQERAQEAKESKHGWHIEAVYRDLASVADRAASRMEVESKRAQGASNLVHAIEKAHSPLVGSSVQEDAVAAVEQRRIDALLAGDVSTLNEIIDDDCTHVESNGVARTKAAFLDDVARREFSFDLFEILENHIRAFGDTAVVAGAYRNIARTGGNALPLKHARHLRVYMRRAGGWKLVAHQATQITGGNLPETP